MQYHIGKECLVAVEFSPLPPLNVGHLQRRGWRACRSVSCFEPTHRRVVNYARVLFSIALKRIRNAASRHSLMGHDTPLTIPAAT